MSLISPGLYVIVLAVDNASKTRAVHCLASMVHRTWQFDSGKCRLDRLQRPCPAPEEACNSGPDVRCIAHALRRAAAGEPPQGASEHARALRECCKPAARAGQTGSLSACTQAVAASVAHPQHTLGSCVLFAVTMIVLNAMARWRQAYLI